MKELSYEQAADFFYETCRMDEDDFVQAAVQFCEEHGIDYESELGRLLDEAIGGTFYAIMHPAIAKRFCFGSQTDYDADIEDLKESFPEQDASYVLNATMGRRNVFDQDYCIVPASYRLAYKALEKQTEAKVVVPYQALKER